MIVRLVWVIIPLVLFGIIGIQESFGEESDNLELLSEQELINEANKLLSEKIEGSENEIKAELDKRLFELNSIIDEFEKRNYIIEISARIDEKSFRIILDHISSIDNESTQTVLKENERQELHVSHRLGGEQSGNVLSAITIGQISKDKYAIYLDKINSYPSENPILGISSLLCAGNHIEINYKITNGELVKIKENPSVFSLFLDVEASEQGILTLYIPKKLIPIGKFQDEVEFSANVIPQEMNRIILHIPPLEISDVFQVAIPFEQGDNEIILSKFEGFLCNNLTKIGSLLQEYFDAGFDNYGIQIDVKKPSGYDFKEEVRSNPPALKSGIEKLHKQRIDGLVKFLEENNAKVEHVYDSGFISANVHRTIIQELLRHDHVRSITCNDNNCGIPIDFDATIIPEDSMIPTKLGGILELNTCKYMGGTIVYETLETKPSGIYKFCKWNERYFGITVPRTCTMSIKTLMYIPTGEILNFGGCGVFDVNKELWKRLDSQEIQLPKKSSQTKIFDFVDPAKDPQHYIHRYNNELAYKEWFDKNYPDITIREAVGLSPTIQDSMKDNVKHWSENQMDKSEFADIVRHVTEQKTDETKADTEKIPDWLANNARWWADGLISEDEFVSGIQYLVEKGIIRVS